jgi:ABC-2 type transport system ATP-binding protein
VTTDQALVIAEGLDKRYRRTHALRAVSFELERGGITALVGPNGAGKSTLLKLCIGFERPTGGRILVAGSDPQRDRGAAVAAIGYVPQTPTLYRELSVIDHLRLSAVLREGFDIAHAIVRLDDLAIPLDSTPGQLSGGQAAQVWLAIALGTRAPLLLLDEPLANLDPLARREFLQVVAAAAAEDDVTVLLSSHVIGDVEPIAQRLLLLADGRILVHDDIAAIRATHRSEPAGSPSPAGDLVAVFPDRAGKPYELRRNGQHPDGPDGQSMAGEPASLEDIVLGYLASVRPKRAARGPEVAARAAEVPA